MPELRSGAGDIVYTRFELVDVAIPEIAQNPLIKSLLVFAAYYALGQSAIHLAIMPEGIATFWPPNAVLVAALLLSPPRQWGLIVAAGIAAEFAGDIGYFPLWQIAGFGAVNAAEAIVSVLCLRWMWLGDESFNVFSLRAALICGVVFLFISTPLAAFGGAAIYALGDASVSYWEFWRLWWFGDAVGLLIMTPFLLVWLSEPLPEALKDRRNWPELAVLLVVTCAGAGLIFSAPPSWPEWAAPPSLLLPILAWAVIRFGLHAATAAVVIIAFAAAAGATDGRGPFIGESSQAVTVLHLQEYLLVVVVLAVVFGTTFRQLNWAMTALYAERRTLEQRITERTREMQEARHAAERQALKDELTGINNRRAFFAKAKAIHDHATSNKRPYSIIMLDLDHFKVVNDTYGHAAGDKALQVVVGTIQSIVRSSDVAGRVGGEEFAVCLPDTSLQAARALAERLRRAVADNAVDWEGHRLMFTCSVGVAEYHNGEASVDPVLNRADDALYGAKRAGRNRIVARH